MTFVHPTASIDGPPEHAIYLGDPSLPTFPVVLGIDVRVHAHVTVDRGTVSPTIVGARTILLAKAHVGHDACVGSDCILATGAIVGGHAVVGNGAKLGLGCIVLPWRHVGARAVVGAGAVVTANVPAGATVAGNPARPITPNPVPFTDRP